ncbi:CCDC83 [Bugula neritina]|uniref:CCDC83 n=1 Tax=Bugula neritina TaxID=10212 RepID=A0A7J7KC17_BUGNE|nr:CCDC83 [Bugula neritina]
MNFNCGSCSVERYEKQCDEILAEVEEIERENLALMSELFENNVNILKITRGLFLTQFEDSESLRDGGILEVDLKQVSLLNRDTDKVTQPPLKAASSDEQDSEEEYFDEYYDDEPLTPTSDTEDPFNNYYNFQDEDITEYLKLGPLQLKLLTISGEQKPIYVQGGSSKAEIQAREFNPVDWPVTQPMMKSATTPRPNVY